MVTIDLIETWVHKGIVDYPRTGENPPFQFLHLPAGHFDRQLINRPRDDAEENYSSDSDDETDSSSNLSGDMPSSTTSKRSYVSAGDATHETFRKQLEKNGVHLLGDLVLLGPLGLEDMEIQKLRDVGGKLDGFDILTELIGKMENQLHWGGPTDEARFQARLESVLTRVINSQTVADDSERYHITSSVNWNRAPLVFHNNNWRDLSQPKVDICFCIASEQSKTAGGSTLHDIGKEVDQDRASEIAELLSHPTLARFLLNDQELAEVCFIPFGKTPYWSIYPISIFEVKATKGDLPIARNQVVNAAVFQCGKHIDLILEAQKGAKAYDIDFTYNERVICLGMSIAGTVWQIDVVFASLEVPISNPRFVSDKHYASGSCCLNLLHYCQFYVKVTGGDWKEDAESFLGAVITMHQYMLHRVVKLLVATYKVFKAYPGQKAIPGITLNSDDMTLPARPLPISEKNSKKALVMVAEEPDVVQDLAEAIETLVLLKEQAQGTSKQSTEQA